MNMYISTYVYLFACVYSWTHHRYLCGFVRYTLTSKTPHAQEACRFMREETHICVHTTTLCVYVEWNGTHTVIQVTTTINLCACLGRNDAMIYIIVSFLI